MRHSSFGRTAPIGPRMARSPTAPRHGAAGVSAAPAAGRPEALVESYRRLAEVFHDVLSEQEPEALLDRIADTLGELMPYEALHIYEADEERRELVPVLARSEYRDEIMRSRAGFGQGITGWAVQHRTPVWTNSAQLDPRAQTVPGTPVEPEALISVPLIARGRVKGALNIYRLGDDGTFFDHEFELAKWFGDAAALALDNAEIRARLEREAQTDSLTGLHNHRYFHERLRSELARAVRSHDSVAVLMFDIDDFKRVNDIHGHAEGDRLLIQLGTIARETVRGSDVVCRLGGEEFAVIMSSCDAGDALGLAARLTERLRATDFEAAADVTVSIGIAQGPDHTANPRELVQFAEAAMMTAKARGKNTVVLFDDSATERPTQLSASRDVRSIAHLKMLQSLAGKLNRLNAVREIGETIANELRLLLEFHNCRVFLREGDDLVPVAFVGELEASTPTEQALKTRVGEGITGRCVARGESLLIANARACEYALRIPGTDDVDESIAAVPLRYGSRVNGAIVISKLGVGLFDEDDVRLLEVLAGQASVALENARLYEAQRREAENAKALLWFAEVVSRARKFSSVCDDSVAAAADLLGVPQVSLWLQQPDGNFSCCSSHGFGEADDELLRVQISPDAAERWLAGRADPFLSAADESPAAQPAARWTRRLVAPLVSGDGVTGWIAVPTDDEELSEERRRLLAGLVYPVSTALHKARVRAPARERGGRECAARRECRARVGRVGGRPAGADRRGDRARPRDAARLAVDRGGGRAARARPGRLRRLRVVQRPAPVPQKCRAPAARSPRRVPARARRPRLPGRRAGRRGRPAAVRCRAAARRRRPRGRAHRLHRRSRFRRSRTSAPDRARPPGKGRDRGRGALREPGADVRLDRRGARERARGEGPVHVLARALDHGDGARRRPRVAARP